MIIEQLGTLDLAPFSGPLTHIMNSQAATKSSHPEQHADLFGVIDIGATSVRMMIAEVNSEGVVRPLENLSQAVSLGKDSFLAGRIKNKTIEDCVRVLQIYRKKLKEEYQIPSNRIRVVATSAVREAHNRQTFQDRVYIATGFDIVPFDSAELHRVTYLGVLPFLESHPLIQDHQTVICEIGGGSTELLVLKNGRVTFSRTYRLGSLRLQKSLETYSLPLSEVRSLMETQINQTVREIRSVVDLDQTIQLIAMGSDMRLAAKKITCHDPRNKLISLDVQALSQFTDKIIADSPDHLVQSLSLSFPEAESLGPALLANLLLARGLEVNQIMVANANMRDGLIKEMAFDSRWSHAVEVQILQSAFNLGRKFQVDETHARHVASLATSFFKQTESFHQVDPRFELLLHLAALLHEVGLFIGYRGYHKHTQYVIRNAEFFGLGAAHIELVAQIARYHRRALPNSSHDAFARLNREDRVIVSKLAAMLRVAKALDATRNQRIKEIKCVIRGKQLVIQVSGTADMTMEELELRQQSKLFQEVFGHAVLLEKKGPA